MTISKSLKVAFAAVLALGLLVPASGQTWGFSHQNRLRFSSPVALPGVSLAPGEYSFDVASPTALDVVVVRNARSGKVLYMGFTNTIERPRNMKDNAPIVFGEAPANAPRPIAAWYEIGEKTGHQFLYR